MSDSASVRYLNAARCVSGPLTVAVLIDRHDGDVW